MVRPRRFRHVWHDVDFDYFKPTGVSLNRLEEVSLNVEELEAIRLDFLGMEQVLASERMRVSQPTYSRILNDARKKIADALINGKAIKIGGGVYKMPNKDGTGPKGLGPGTGMGYGPCGAGMREKVRGFGWRRFSASQNSRSINEKEFLENQLRMLESDQKQITEEIESLKKKLEQTEGGK